MIHQISPRISGALSTLEEGDSLVEVLATPSPVSLTLSEGNGFSFNVPSQNSGSYSPSSGQESPVRGRALTRAPSTNRSDVRPRTSTNLEASARFFGFENTLTYQRLLSRDLTSEPDNMFSAVMEPLPFGVERFRSSLTEELYKAATWQNWEDSIDLTKFGDHRDTFAILGMRRLQDRRLELPGEFWERLLPYIEYEIYLNIRRSCRCWSAAITRARPLQMPSVARLPAEILQNIYRRLDPMDFNAARHTCRAWMITSLDENLLRPMLSRAGWSGAVQADMEAQERNGQCSMDDVNMEWLLSRRLATECSLRPGWTGNGLLKDSFGSPDGDLLPTIGLVRTSQTNFSALSNGYASILENEIGAGLHFTVSVCNKFLLVTEGCIIYIYSLRTNWLNKNQPGGHLSPVTTVICPHRVLAVSMDTSLNRHAIAALLDDRLGLVCDLDQTLPGPGTMSNDPRSFGNRIVTEATSPRVYGTTSNKDAAPSSTYLSNQAMARTIADVTLPDLNGDRPSGTTRTLDTSVLTRVPTGPAPFPTIINASNFHIETGPRSIYRNLCSAEDPPRSVAICPQRRCVAFGCIAGIELHWIDAMTGQDLNRWFPLTAPSDFLYFLPPRSGVDSAKKLRLISSARHPKEKGGLRSKFFPGGGESMNWEEGPNATVEWDNAWRGNAFSDHYCAVPIGDGWNILFTDPEDGSLCFGSDAPPGRGATKLIRRYIFVGPKDAEGKTIAPRVYKSGGEQRWGTRIVVGYAESLWLFVIPPDDCAQGVKKEKCERVERHAGDEQTKPAAVKIDGVELSRTAGLVDIAVDTAGGDLTIWAFAVNGMAYVWQLGCGSQSNVERVVLRDGTIISAEDEDGDSYMHDAFTGPKRAVQFDGSASARPLQFLSIGAQDRIIDNDGDIAMPDVTSEEDEGYASGTEEFEQAGGAFAIHVPPLHGRWSQESADWVPQYLSANGDGIEDEGLGVDVLELGRCEIEILSTHLEVGGVGFGRWTTEIAAMSR